MVDRNLTLLVITLTCNHKIELTDEMEKKSKKRKDVACNFGM